MAHSTREVTTLPTLYKRSATGATQEWNIHASLNDNNTASVITIYGQKGGRMQTTETVVKAGKNIGRANATDCYAQALAEAQSKWKKQIDKGYGVSDEVAKPSQKPMLAHKYEDYKHKVIWPAYAQPKLDGIRCLAKQEGDGIVLLSRGNKPITTMGHIVKDLHLLMYNSMFPSPTLDGELYVHGEKFQNIVSWVKREQPNSLKVEYHVYDTIDTDSFPRRFDMMALDCMTDGLNIKTIKEVFYKKINSEQELADAHNEWVKQGYEGAMLRHGKCTYKEGYRSQALLKYKAFLDEEFTVVGVRQGNKGRSEGMAIFRCRTDAGGEFDCMPEGTEEMRRAYWDFRDQYIGKKMTVRFFGWTTSTPPLPRFPIGVAVREDD